MAGAQDVALFSQVSFLINESEELDRDAAQRLARTLTSHGAEQHPTSTLKDPASLHGLTHIISATIDFQAYEYATNMLINVVTPGWVETSVLKKRLANPKSHSPDPRLFYSGLVVCTADLPEGDKDAIIGGVLAMGGLYSGHISKLVTHLVALNMEPQACQVVKAKNLQCKIVLPHWFDDCLRLGKRIDERPYLLPNPELMTKGLRDQIVMTTRPDLQGALSAQVGSSPPLPPPISQDRKHLSVFDGKRIRLGDNLSIAAHLRNSIEDIIKQARGQIVDSVGDADIFICQYREGNDYLEASSDGKIVGNLPWLYHLITHNVWTSPLKRLLHYPIAREGLPEVKNFRISLSNYNGEARVYLENLAKAAGCEFTRTMKQDNTHLITAHTASEKCEAAKEWNIHIINHLWLEESYAKWQVQSIANSRYTHFPPRTNLTEVVGQTPIDKDALQRHFFSKPIKGRVDASMRPPPHTPAAAGKSKIDKTTTTPDSKPTHQTSPHQVGPVSEHGHLKTPRIGGLSIEDKENDTPSTTGSRSAKSKALSQIHDLKDDIIKYQRESKRVGGVIFGGRRRKDEIVEESRKRSASPNDEDELDSAEATRQRKRPKQSKPPLEMRVLVTGYSRWTDDPKAHAKERDQLRALGILVTQDSKNCAFLVAPKILRTQKFCCAIAQSPVILSTGYLEACLDKGKLLRPEDYLLRDDIGEERYDLKIEGVLDRAKSNRGRLLNGQSIWITDGIHGGYESYKSIVEANGGTCSLFRGRAGSITTRTAEADGDDHDGSDDYVVLISGLTPSETRLWPKFQQMSTAAGLTPRIVKTDWLLDLALSQHVQWKEAHQAASQIAFEEKA